MAKMTPGPHIFSLAPQEWKGLCKALFLTMNLEYTTHCEKRRWLEEGGSGKTIKKNQNSSLNRDVATPDQFWSQAGL